MENKDLPKVKTLDDPNKGLYRPVTVHVLQESLVLLGLGEGVGAGAVMKTFSQLIRMYFFK